MVTRHYLRYGRSPGTKNLPSQVTNDNHPDVAPALISVFVGRDIRSQLERALQKAEAHRVDELSAIARADAGEKEKVDLEAR